MWKPQERLHAPAVASVNKSRLYAAVNGQTHTRTGEHAWEQCVRHAGWQTSVRLCVQASGTEQHF